MITLRRVVVPVLCVAASIAGLTAYAAAPLDPASESGAPAGGPDGPGGPGGQWHHGHRGAGPGEMGFLLHKLNLTADQKAKVKTIMAGQKSQFEALRASSQANRDALATTPPNDAGYPALIQTAENNANARITLMSSTWKQVYETVLTQAQQQAIPGIVAAAKAARQSRMEEWQAQHAQ